MPRKCCVPLCKANYKTGEPATTFRFPKNEEQKISWQKAIPRLNLTVTKNTVVCEKHWPEDYETYVHYGKIRPVNPPSVFSDIPDSCVPSVIKKRQTRTSTEGNRGVQLDELGEFNIQDNLDYNRIIEATSRMENIIAFEDSSGTSVVFQSTEMHGGIPQFSIIVH